MSSQCCWVASLFRAGNQLPAIESPTRTMVSRGLTASPYTHSFGTGEVASSRQPCRQYSGSIVAGAWVSGGRTCLVGTLEGALVPACAASASTAAPGWPGPSWPFQGGGLVTRNPNT